MGRATIYQAYGRRAYTPCARRRRCDVLTRGCHGGAGGQMYRNHTPPYYGESSPPPRCQNQSFPSPPPPPRGIIIYYVYLTRPPVTYTGHPRKSHPRTDDGVIERVIYCDPLLSPTRPMINFEKFIRKRGSNTCPMPNFSPSAYGLLSR